MFGENFFYMLYFQEPGVADAELNADPARTMRRMMGGLRASGDQSAALRMVAPGPEGFVDRLPEPDELPDWISQDELDHYISEFSRTGFTGGLNWYRNFDRNWETTPELADATITVPSLFIARDSRSGAGIHPRRPRRGGDLRSLSPGDDRRRRTLAAAGTPRRGERDPVGVPQRIGAAMSAPLRFGVFITPFHPIGQSPTVALEYDMERVVALDRLGFDEAWFGEHHSGGYELIACPEVFIAAAAERTKHIRLGTGVVSLPYHHPLMVADRWVLLDHLTRGRVMFGTGPGALPSDAYMMGIDPVEQRRMMQESLEAILALFRAAPSERIDRHSDWFTLRDAQLHIRPYTWPYPEISTAAMISPSGPAAGRCAGHVAAVAVDVGARRLRGAGEHLGGGARAGRQSRPRRA